jgi:hypothetical protein
MLEAVAELIVDASVRLFDTGTSLASFSNESVKNWVSVGEGKLSHAFSGDAVLINDRLAILFRRGGSGAIVYAREQVSERARVNEQARFSLRAVLAPGTFFRAPIQSGEIEAPGSRASLKLESLTISKNSSNEIALDASFNAPSDSAPRSACIRYSLSAEHCHVKTESLDGVHALAVESPSRFVVVPDLFADDIVLDAIEITTDTAHLPRDNFLLHMLPGHNAIVMTVTENSDQEARLKLKGSDQQRVFKGSEISYGSSGRVFVAVLEVPGIWHHRDVRTDEINKIIALEWTAPFSAQWRVDWQAVDKLTKSWKMIVQQEDGQFQRFSMWRSSSGIVPHDRKCWATYLRDYFHPCWLDKSGRGYLQPLSEPVRFVGPVIVYPISRLKTTQRNQFCVIDVAVSALGVDASRNILDVAGQITSLKGIATCSARDTLTPIYAANHQRQKRIQIQRVLSDVLIFVQSIRERIEAYSSFGREMIAYLDEQQGPNDLTKVEQANFEVTEFLTEMKTLSKVIDDKIEERRNLIKNPTIR